jgi:uncharacterized protein YbgA (DUF1722 family)/uncharacterized protein YbbK (DUF523 family)
MAGRRGASTTSSEQLSRYKRRVGAARETSSRQGEAAGPRIRVAVSACLLGEPVRYDAGHKHDRYVTDVLAAHFELVPVCPEVEVGMGTPREALRLVRVGSEVRMRGVTSGSDHTEAMRRFAGRRIAALSRLGISGYILKKSSPSCGMERVRVYTAAGMPSHSQPGIFAAELLREMPLLPVEEEGRLCDAVLRESFIERVFAHHRVTELFGGRWTMKSLVEFHTREKMLLSAHQPAAATALGRIVAGAAGVPRAEVALAYRTGFLQALAKPALPRRHVNVLQHMLGQFRGVLDARARAALAEVIEDYRQGLVPLVVPITLVRHYVDLHGIATLARQTYLEPHPRELLLRNHV